MIGVIKIMTMQWPKIVRIIGYVPRTMRVTLVVLERQHRF